MQNLTLRKQKFHKLALGFVACIALSACGATTQKNKNEQTNVSAVDSAIERASQTAAKSGSKSVISLERDYKRSPSNALVATNYAHALRENDYANRAAVVLAPFANDASSPAVTKSEYAAIQLALGNNTGAEDYAQKAILQDPENYQAFHFLGIALDAKGEHEKAERAFRKGLEHWQGDPTPIMNNLALNLTAQGFLDEAADLLQKAKAVAPNRVEIERNLRIVRALQQSEGGLVPKPHNKPNSNKPAQTANN